MASTTRTHAPPRRRTVLWIDDEVDMLEPHRLFLADKGYEVHVATNADDAVELLRRQHFDLVLLDEQMPGKRGLEAYRELREIAPNLPVVMVTKSEDDTTLRDALGADIRDYLVKPVNPRQVLSAVTKILDGPALRQQATAHAFVERFRTLESERTRDLTWRGWIDRFDELMHWDIELSLAGERGLYESLRGMYPAMHRDFAVFMQRDYPRWLRDLEGDRPPLSIDVVGEFLLPALRRSRAVLFIVVDCLRLDQWHMLQRSLTSMFEVETSHYFAILPTATPYARNALFSGLFPGEIAARFPDWWGSADRDDETLNAHERALLEAHLSELGEKSPVRYHKISTPGDSEDLERHLASSIAQDGVSAFVFNFIDLLTHGRSESAILYEVARDEIALRQLTQQWFQRSALLSVLREAVRRRLPVLLTSDHGSIHCQTPATVFAKRDATANLRYKFGEDLRAERPEQALLFPNEDLLRLPRRGLGGNTLLAVGDTFFVYPTKLREYQSRYRGSFLHGGVTPEECIVPLALLTPAMTYRRLLVFMRPQAWRMAAVVVANVLAAVLDVLVFTLTIPFLDQVFGTATNPGPITTAQRWLIGWFYDPADAFGSLTTIIIIILIAVVVKNLLVWLSGQFSAQAQELVTRDLRNAFYRHVQRLPLGYFTRTRAGQTLARVFTDTQQTKQVITESVTRSIQSAAVVLTSITVCFFISWRLTLLALVVAPVLIAFLWPLLRKLRRGHRRLGDQYGEMTSVVQEAVSGIRLVKSFRGEAYEEGRFFEASNRYARGMIRVQRLAFLAQPITETVGTAIAVVILGIGAREVLVTRSLSGSELIAFLLLVLRMLQPLKQLSQVPTVAQQSLAAAERLFEVMDRPTEAMLDRGTRSVTTLQHELAFEHVTFAYEDAPVLSDVSFSIRKGEVVALVGPSGAGKSTLVDLIPRFHEPTAGRITLDGVDTKEISLQSLRALTGIVSQDTVLFNDTVRQNIAYAAAGKFSSTEIEVAARAANAHDFIMALPNGYDTVLGERGTRLSGGQRQRLAIARALLIDPPILILDEATSALDTESERLVQEAIERLLTGRTVIVIAHRLSTVQHATQILVLERGRIVERGTHAVLLAAGNGVYRRLHELQFADRPVLAGDVGGA